MDGEHASPSFVLLQHRAHIGDSVVLGARDQKGFQMDVKLGQEGIFISFCSYFLVVCLATALRSRTKKTVRAGMRVCVLGLCGLLVAVLWKAPVSWWFALVWAGTGGILSWELYLYCIIYPEQDDTSADTCR